MGRFDASVMTARMNDVKNATADVQGSKVVNEGFQSLRIEDIVPCKDNSYPQSDIEELAHDINDRGLEHNLVVAKCNKEVADHYGIDESKYLLISGHRRFAAIQWGNENIDGMSIAEVVCKVNNFESVAMARLYLHMDNLQARVLDDVTLMKAYSELKEILAELEREGAKIVGRKRDWIANRLKVSSAQVGKMENIDRHAAPEVKEQVKSGDLSINAANEIAKLDTSEQKNIVSNFSGNEAYQKAKEIKREQKRSTITNTTVTERNTERGEMPKPIEKEHDTVVQNRTVMENANDNYSSASLNNFSATADTEVKEKVNDEWTPELIIQCLNFVFDKYSNKISEEAQNQLKAIKYMALNLFRKDLEQVKKFIET